jgi:hypothetical protein
LSINAGGFFKFLISFYCGPHQAPGFSGTGAAGKNQWIQKVSAARKRPRTYVGAQGVIIVLTLIFIFIIIRLGHIEVFAMD